MHTLSLEGATRNSRESTQNASRWSSDFRSVVERDLHPALVLAAEVMIAVLAYVSSVIVLPQTDGIVSGGIDTWSKVGISAAAALLASASTALHGRSLRHANILDVRPLMQAVILNLGLLASFLGLDGANLYASVRLILLDAFILTFGWGVLHFGAQTWRANRASRRRTGARAVIVGAGDAGLTLVRQTALDPASGFRPVALADDDSRKWGRRLFGVPVLGATRDVAKIASQARAEAILVCIPSATHAQMHDILDACRQMNLPVRSLPSLSDLIQCAAISNISTRQLGAPRVEHLLQRDEFRPDIQMTRSLIEGKTVLVTGAGGSIGSELAKQIASARPRKLLLLDKSENNLFYVNLAIAESIGFKSVKPILADLSSANRTQAILKAERPDLIFHAAAYKHVSMIELHPGEAIRNNVLGTRNLAQAALQFGVTSLVNISTDKAVDPVSFMGLSKKITELCIQEFARQASAKNLATRFSNVRFGNVAGSTGSVIPLFYEQIQRGGPIRVTDPQASRYFMSVAEAVHLILGAAELGKSGETFVFDMGEPFNIYQLAKTMALFSGLRPHRDIAIEFMGLRKGEKLNEQLWDDWERPVATSSKRILVVREKDARSGGILNAVHEMERALAAEDTSALMPYIGQLFPKFYSGSDSCKRPSNISCSTSRLAAIDPVEAA